jgi:rhodanese-related sulfurtransferase
MLMGLPGTFEIVDVRPPAQYAGFSLPGSINADIADVIANPAYLKGTVPLIIVDRECCHRGLTQAAHRDEQSAGAPPLNQRDGMVHHTCDGA